MRKRTDRPNVTINIHFFSGNKLSGKAKMANIILMVAMIVLVTLAISCFEPKELVNLVRSVIGMASGA